MWDSQIFGGDRLKRRAKCGTCPLFQGLRRDFFMFAPNALGKIPYTFLNKLTPPLKCQKTEFLDKFQTVPFFFTLSLPILGLSSELNYTPYPVIIENRKNDLILIITPEKQDKTLELSKHWSADSTPARNEVIMKRTYPVKSVKCDKICSNY